MMKNIMYFMCLIFGSMCNIGFLESGYILKEEWTTDETLPELLDDLECYYNSGGDYTTNIVYNERM